MMNHINSFTFCFIPSHFIDAMIIRYSVISAFTSFFINFERRNLVSFYAKNASDLS